MNGDPQKSELQDLLLQTLHDEGFAGDMDALKDKVLSNPDGFESIYRTLDSAGFEGSRRDLVYIFGVNPKKKESAISSDYYTSIGLPSGDTGVEDPRDTQTAADIQAQAEASRVDFLQGLFGDNAEYGLGDLDPDPYIALQQTPDQRYGEGSGVTYTEEDASILYEKEQKKMREAYTTPGVVPDPAIVAQRDYFVYREAKKWMQKNNMVPGAPMSAADAERLASEFYDSYKHVKIFKDAQVTKDLAVNVMTRSGLITESKDLIPNKEFRKVSITNDAFSFSRYTSDQIANIPTVENEDGNIVPFYEDALEKINPSYKPENEEQLAAAQELMPERLSTFESAEEYYNSIGEELTPEKYIDIAGYWTARSEVVNAQAAKKDVVSQVNDYVERYNRALAEDDKQSILKEMMGNQVDLVNAYNEANEVLALDRRAYDIRDILDNNILDTIVETGESTVTNYFNSAAYIGKRIKESIYSATGSEDHAVNLFTTVGSIMYGTQNMLSSFQSAMKERAAADPMAVFDPLVVYALTIGDIPRAEETLARKLDLPEGQTMSWSEISAGIQQAQVLHKGVTLDQMERGVMENYARGDFEAGHIMFMAGVEDALPQIGIQIAGMFTGTTSLTLGAMAMGSGGAMIEELDKNPNLSEGEKFLYGLTAAGVEFVSERLFMRTELGVVNAVRKSLGKSARKTTGLLWGAIPAEKGLLKAVNKTWTKTTGSRAFMFFEEGIEEGLVAIADASLRNMAERTGLRREIEQLQIDMQTEGISGENKLLIQSQINAKESQIDKLAVSWYQVADSFAIGLAAGSIQVGVMKSVSYLSSISTRDHIKLQTKMEKLKADLNKAKTDDEKSSIRREIIKVQEQMQRIASRDLEFLSRMSDEDVMEIFGHNQKIAMARAEARRKRARLAKAKEDGDTETVAVLEAEIQDLQNQTRAAFEAKFAVESKYQNEADYINGMLDSVDTLAVLDEVGRVDPEVADYGRVGRGNTVELDADNATTLIERIIAKGKIVTTRFSTREEIVQGLRNVAKAIATITANGGTGRVFLHGTMKAYTKATGEQGLASGLFITETGDVHLFMPALKANTAYHEAFHAAQIRNENRDETKSGTRRLAAHFLRNMSGEYLNSKLDFITGILQQILDPAAMQDIVEKLIAAGGDPAKIRKILIDTVLSDYRIADEVLTEIKADLTSGSADISMRKNSIKALRDFVKEKLGGKVKDPKLQQVVDAINRATGQMSRGEAVEDTSDIMRAAQDVKVPRNFKPQTSDEEREAKNQIIGANANLSEGVRSHYNTANLLESQLDNKGNRLYSEQDIYVMTGWERGADGKWRYEIPDMLTREFTMDDIGKDFLLSDFIQGELMEMYPELADITVQVREGTGFTYGSYDSNPRNIIIYHGGRDLDRMQRTGRGGERLDSKPETADSYDARQSVLSQSTLIHEVQHAIQEIEGFAVGGNLGSTLMSMAVQEYHSERRNARRGKSFDEYRSLRDDANRLLKIEAGAALYDALIRNVQDPELRSFLEANLAVIKQVVEDLRALEPLRDTYRTVKKEASPLFAAMIRLELSLEGIEKLKELQKRQSDIRNQLNELQADLYRRADDVTGEIGSQGIIDAFEASNESVGLNDSIYGALAGEVEARNAQRRFMNPSMLESNIASTEDVTRTDQKVFFEASLTASSKASDTPVMDRDGIFSGDVSTDASSTGTTVDATELGSKTQPLSDLNLSRPANLLSNVMTGQDLSSLGKIVAALTFADRQTVGTMGDYEYLGGILYAARTGNVWASQSLQKANAIVKGMAENSDGYRYLLPALMNPDSHMSNINMQLTAIGMMRQAILDKEISTKEAHARIKKALSKKALLPYRDIYLSRVKSDNPRLKTLDLAIIETFTNSSMTFDERRAFLESLLGKAELRTSVRFGNLPTYNALAEMMAEPLSVGHNRGDVLLAIRTSGDLQVVQPEPGDPDYHPSYSYVIRAVDENGNKVPVETMIFNQSYSAIDIFPEVTNAQGNTVSFQDYVDKYGPEQARGKYIGYIGGRNTMSIDVSEEIDMAAAATGLDVNVLSDLIFEMQEATSQGDQSKKTQPIVNTIMQAMTEQGYTLKMKGKGKNRKLVLEPSAQLVIKPLKSDIIQILTAAGMTTEQAESTYQKAKHQARGRRQAIQEQQKIQRKLQRDMDKLSTQAKNLRDELGQLKNKVSTIKEFTKEAKKLIAARMKKDAGTSNRFTAAQIKQFFTIMGKAANVSAQKLEGNEMDYIDTFLDQLAVIFDQQDQKAAMEQYMKSRKKAEDIQKTLKKKAKQKDFGSYRNVAAILAGINTRYIPETEIEALIDLMERVNQSMRRARFGKDKGGDIIITTTQLLEAQGLMTEATVFKAIEAATMDARIRVKAQQNLDKATKAGKKTTFDEELKKLLDKFDQARLTKIEKDINKKAKELKLDPNNVQDLETILEEIAKDQAAELDIQKDLILTEGILPKLVMHGDELLMNPDFAMIFGTNNPADLGGATLVRLSQLEKHHLLALEYKINDYLVNGGINGLGYMAAIVRGVVDNPGKIKDLTKSGIKARPKVLGQIFDNLSSFIRNAFAASNIDIARIKVALGLQNVIMSVNRHEQQHIQVANALGNKIKEIHKKYGVTTQDRVAARFDKIITSQYSQAIMQIYSMSRQMPSRGHNEASWFLALREAMTATLDYNVKNKMFGKGVMEQHQRALDFLFDGVESLQELQAKVEAEKPALVEMVDFMVQMHEAARPDLEQFTERFLSKQLEVVPSYTAFRVRKKSDKPEVGSVMELRSKLLSTMTQVGKAGYTKVPGSTFERENRAIDSNAVLGLDFIRLNERALRENNFIMNTIGDVLAMKYTFQSSEASQMMNDKVKMALEQQIDDYLMGDNQSEPFIFRQHMNFGSVEIPFNPIEMFRAAAVVRAFASVIIQLFKQGTVGFATMLNVAKNPTVMIYYLQETATNLALTVAGRDRNGKIRFFSDVKPKISSDKLELLKLSAIFSRDYKAGNIDPFTGRVTYDKKLFYAARDKFTEKSMWTLGTTDKVVAISSFYAYYANYLVNNGLADSAYSIDWKEQSANPNMEALAYADNMVEKDQNTSSARMAAAVYKKNNGFGRVLMQMLLPFQSFAINTKRSVTADFGRLLSFDSDAESRVDGAKGLAATAAGAYMFSVASKLTLAAFSYLWSALSGDDDDEEKFTDHIPDKLLRDSGVQTVVDMLPAPSTSIIDDTAKDAFNYYVFFNESDYDMPGLEKMDKFVLYKKYGDAMPTYGGLVQRLAVEDETPFITFTNTLLDGIGPAGDMMKDVQKSYAVLENDGQSYISGSGRERFIRPEDQDDFRTSHMLRLGLMGANMMGVGVKEMEYFSKAMDNQAIDRALSSEEELAAYELVSKAMSGDPEIKAMLNASKNTDVDRLVSILKMQAENDPATLSRGTSISRFMKALDPAIAEQILQRNMPLEYKEHMKEVRRLTRETPKKIAAVMRAKEESMSPDEYSRYENFLFVYLAFKSEQSINNILLERALSK